MSPGMLLRALTVLWRVGLLRVTPRGLWRAVGAWRRCRASLPFLVEVAAIRFGNHPALGDDDGSLTYGELREAYEALARRLVGELGVAPGQVLAILGENHRDFLVALLAAARTGADVLLLNPRSPPLVLQGLLSEQGPDIVLNATSLDLGQVAPDTRQLTLPVEPDRAYQAVVLPRLGRAGRLVILTSGSTGRARRISRRPPLASLLPAAVAFLELLPISLHRPTVIAVPLFHGHGLSSLAMALACAAPIQLGRRYEIAPLLSRLPAGAQPIVVSVPTLLERWQATGPGAAPVGAIVTGSAPLDPRLCQQILETRGPVLYNLYGSSEAGVVSMASPAMLQAAPGTVGRPLPGNEVRIVGPGGRQAPPGQVGGIQVRGPLVAPVDTGDWFDTGDLGRLDEEQRLHVCGRADQMFVSGGENVYPQRVRECLQDHPAVHEAVIAVVQDPEFGHRMRAFVVARPGMPLEHDELREWIRERVERFEVPRSIEILPDLPRNALGKVDRPALLELPETRSHSA